MFLLDKIMDKDLHRLLETMNSSKNVKKYNKFKVLPAIGEIVIAKHWSNYWVRAIVREYFNYNDNFKVQVFLLDFGDIFDVCAKDLRQITEVYLELPFQVLIQLFNIVKTLFRDILGSGMLFRKRTRKTKRGQSESETIF